MPSAAIVIADNDAITLPRSVRLRSPQQFQNTVSQGRRISAALFRLHVRLQAPQTMAAGKQPIDPATPRHTRLTDAQDNDAATSARLGISVSKRVAAHAVERNRIKRIARESFRHRRMQLPPGDYVLLAQRDAANASPDALRDALSALWQRACALKPAPAAPTMPARASIDGESH
jgi:ribonuclease P protein component